MVVDALSRKAIGHLGYMQKVQLPLMVELLKIGVVLKIGLANFLVQPILIDCIHDPKFIIPF